MRLLSAIYLQKGQKKPLFLQCNHILILHLIKLLSFLLISLTIFAIILPRNIMKILHTADIHIGAKNSRLPALKQQILKEENILQLNSLFTKLHDEHYDMMIIAGDLFHSKNISQRLASSFFRKVEEIKIPVIYILGNHDEKFIFNHVPENFIILNEDRPFYQFDNIKILSIYQNESESSSADDVNILVAHGDIYNSSSRDYLDLSRLTTNNNIDLVLLGHIHSYRKEDIGKTTIIYPGSLFSNGFDECGDKGYVEIQNLFHLPNIDICLKSVI